jgi:hypothetical protein
VSGGNFNPSTAGVGTFPITYSLTQNGCTGTASSSIVVNACADVNEENKSKLIIYPNPVSNMLTIKGEDIMLFKEIELFDASGRSVQKWKANGTEMNLDLSNFASGSYSLHFNGTGQMRSERIEIVK